MSERMYHINLCKEELEGAKAVILPGDPGRVPKIAALLQEAKPLAQNREYTSWLGRLEGQPVAVVSTGIGGPSAAIAVEELAQLGVETFVRVGTCGGMQLDVKAGDLVVVNAAIRMEGTSREYLPIEFPAVADFEVTAALRDEAQALGFAHHVGVVQCKDSFYGQHDPASMPVERLDQGRRPGQRNGDGGALHGLQRAAAARRRRDAVHLEPGARGCRPAPGAGI